MTFRVDDEKLLEKYKAVQAKIEDLKNIELNALPVYNHKYIKTKIRSYRDKFYTAFSDLNVAEDDIICKSFAVLSIDLMPIYKNKYYLQVYLDNCAYKIVNKQIPAYLDESLFEDYKCFFQILYMLYYDNAKCCIDICEGIGPTKSNKMEECMICHYCLFNYGFKFQDLEDRGYITKILS